MTTSDKKNKANKFRVETKVFPHESSLINLSENPKQKPVIQSRIDFVCDINVLTYFLSTKTGCRILGLKRELLADTGELASLWAVNYSGTVMAVAALNSGDLARQALLDLFVTIDVVGQCPTPLPLHILQHQWNSLKDGSAHHAQLWISVMVANTDVRFWPWPEGQILLQNAQCHMGVVSVGKSVLIPDRP